MKLFSDAKHTTFICFMYLLVIVYCIQQKTKALNIGWIGLGAMGKYMASHVNSKYCLSTSSDNKSNALKVWNRNHQVSINHSKHYQTEAVPLLADIGKHCSIIFVSLPSSNEVKDILSKCNLQPNTIVIDTTSGDPAMTLEIAKSLETNNIKLIDCPVSGGPKGAEAGSLTTMIGGDSDVAHNIVIPLVESTFSKKAVYCGNSGSGMAVKAINNILNTAHCLIATEGLLALQNFGVSPDIALDVINSSSGRSLATTDRIPQEILTRKFSFGFKLSLMSKDCRTANSLIQSYFPEATLLPEVNQLINIAEEQQYHQKNSTADYTEVIKLLENRAKANLKGTCS